MSNVTATNAVCAPYAAWSRPRPAGASAVGATALLLAVSGTGVVKHAQKRFTMAGTDINGWPLGPRDGTSG